MSYFRAGIGLGLIWGVLADVFLLFIVLPQPDVIPGVTEPAGWYQAIAPAGFALISVPFFASLGTYRAVAAILPGIGVSDFFMVLVLCPVYGMIVGAALGFFADIVRAGKKRR